jgi:hypothetical protein
MQLVSQEFLQAAVVASRKSVPAGRFARRTNAFVSLYDEFSSMHFNWYIANNQTGIASELSDPLLAAQFQVLVNLHFGVVDVGAHSQWEAQRQQSYLYRRNRRVDIVQMHVNAIAVAAASACKTDEEAIITAMKGKEKEKHRKKMALHSRCRSVPRAMLLSAAFNFGNAGVLFSTIAEGGDSTAWTARAWAEAAVDNIKPTFTATFSKPSMQKKNKKKKTGDKQAKAFQKVRLGHLPA